MRNRQQAHQIDKSATERLAESRASDEYVRTQRLIRPRYDIIIELVNLRHRLGLTQGDVAKLSHMHQSRISKIESAEYDLRISTLAELADALKTDLEIKLVSRIPHETFAKLIDELCAEPADEDKVWIAPTAPPSVRSEEVLALR
jgi:transcriptional regulator with XRE-family HTH domain